MYRDPDFSREKFGFVAMIVPMKKATIVVQAQDARPAVEKMRSLGVVHVEHCLPPQGKEISTLKEEEDLIAQVLRILALQTNKSRTIQETAVVQDWKAAAHHIIDLHKRIEQLEEYSRSLKASISQWEEWGDFDPQAIRHLAESGLEIKLFQLPLKEMENIPAGIVVEKINTRGGIANCVLISRSKIDIGFREVPLPKMGLARMRQRLVEDTRVISDIKKELEKQAACKNYFSGKMALLHKELEFREALAGMGSAEKIMFIKGYIPYDAVSLIEQTAKKEKWGMVIEEPSAEDNIPTLIRSPRWVSIIRPVFKLLEIIPGYRELDISPLFLIFLSLFFGMIIGDAGYGVVYFLLTFFLHKKFVKKFNDTRIFFLLYVFSACAILWGLLTGTVFGQEWYLRAGLKPFIPVLNDTKALQAFCFFVGAFHLSLAHSWQALRKMPSLTALSDLGWICILWAAFFLAKTLILDAPFPSFGKGLILVGLFLVIFCTSPQKNIFKTIGQGLGTAALSLMNNFTDVVSYVRLFAIGLAGVAIADTVNSLAAGLGTANPLAKMLVIFIGHTVNLLLGPVSVLVHGIRLNVLEFSSHAGLSWSGLAYKPLRE
jgi:V/A-type H+-transporting ATPase subunit I